MGLTDLNRMLTFCRLETTKQEYLETVRIQITTEGGISSEYALFTQTKSFIGEGNAKL